MSLQERKERERDRVRPLTFPEWTSKNELVVKMVQLESSKKDAY